MTDATPVSSRQKAVDRYLRAGNIGTAAAIASPVIYFAMVSILADWKEGDSVLLVLLLFLAIVVYLICEAYSVFHVFFRRKTDEYTLAMWHSGTTFAFFAAMLWLILGPWVETGVYVYLDFDVFESASARENTSFEGILDEPATRASVIEQFATPVILAAFFLGFQYKRFKGAY
ncbi:hypothetical protein [Erythrobacter sp. JK5]|uniref:hypothetical protein n=1 Tax=Erythrobacter sp. JK5 TaxID=2829500 RepID=UPI001BA4FE6A|nr:hypothetical protein [Erythrobacter sp. JK5]QUL38755.1 hypothetical protein KDC96_05110 [Erythrobacter sp. JK5]